MTNVYCTDVSCKFVNEEGVCTAKKVAFGWVSVMTVNGERQKYNKCKTYEKSEQAKKLHDLIEEQDGDSDG